MSVRVLFQVAPGDSLELPPLTDDTPWDPPLPVVGDEMEFFRYWPDMAAENWHAPLRPDAVCVRVVRVHWRLNVFYDSVEKFLVLTLATKPRDGGG